VSCDWYHWTYVYVLWTFPVYYFREVRWCLKRDGTICGCKFLKYNNLWNVFSKSVRSLTAEAKLVTCMLERFPLGNIAGLAMWSSGRQTSACRDPRTRLRPKQTRLSYYVVWAKQRAADLRSLPAPSRLPRTNEISLITLRPTCHRKSNFTGNPVKFSLKIIQFCSF